MRTYRAVFIAYQKGAKGARQTYTETLQAEDKVLALEQIYIRFERVSMLSMEEV